MTSNLSRKAQSSVEYLFVVVLSLMLIVPASMIFFNYSKNSEGSIISAQVTRIGNNILSKGEEIYVIGNNSRVTLEFLLPDGYDSAYIYNEQELVINYYLQGGITQAVFFTDIPLANATHRCASSCTINLAAGANSLRIISRGDHLLLVRI